MTLSALANAIIDANGTSPGRVLDPAHAPAEMLDAAFLVQDVLRRDGISIRMLLITRYAQGSYDVGMESTYASLQIGPSGTHAYAERRYYGRRMPPLTAYIWVLPSKTQDAARAIRALGTLCVVVEGGIVGVEFSQPEEN
jgi:hypothetical protein